MIQTNKKGQNQADNIIDNLLSFNIPSIWTVNNAGSATITNTKYFNGSGSLKIENTNPTKFNCNKCNTINRDKKRR